MIDFDKSQESFSILSVAYIFFVAMLGGTVSFIKKVKQGQKWRICDFIAEMATSAFAGIIAAYLCQWAEVPFNGTVAIVGIAGHMGIKFVYMLEKLFEDRLEAVADKLTQGKKD